MQGIDVVQSSKKIRLTRLNMTKGLTLGHGKIIVACNAKMLCAFDRSKTTMIFFATLAPCLSLSNHEFTTACFDLLFLLQLARKFIISGPLIAKTKPS